MIRIICVLCLAGVLLPAQSAHAQRSGHLANNRAGSFVKTLDVSALIFGAEVLALNALVDDGRTEHKQLVMGIAALAPMIQVIASVLVERSGREHAKYPN